jgi:hypothetical protein
MAARLSLKLGVVGGDDRLPASPDTVVVVEPTVGSVARTKGNLYLLVTSQLPGSRAREATRLIATTVRDEYYYDESAGIRACLEKVINLANKRLQHSRDRLGLGRGAAGPLGVAAAVVRGSELYVVTVGPADAYLIRGARLSTLPDPDRGRGLPTDELMPDVWRGELEVGDSLVLTAPDLVSRVGTDALKESLVTLHPQAAVDQLHQQYSAAGGSGSDGIIAFEATEVGFTHQTRTLVPVRADEPLAGAPDRSPIPLADTVTDGVAAVQTGARQARRTAGGWADRSIGWLQDRLPRRATAYRRVTPLATRQERQRRGAMAIIAILIVAGGLGVAVWLAGGSGQHQDVASFTAGEKSLDDAKAAIAEVWAPGVDLVRGDPHRAQDLLTGAYQDLQDAAASGIPLAAIAPLRSQVVSGLDELYDVVEVRATVLFDFPADPGADLQQLIEGPDGIPYAIDAVSSSVLRIDTAAQTAKPILTAGATIGGVKVGTPKLLAVGGPDLLVLDTNNNLWRWRPADAKGRGTTVRVTVHDSPSWGNDIRAIATFCRNADCSLYNLYIVDPSERQIMVYTPAADGHGYPGTGTGRLATARDVSTFDDMYIDGDIFVTDAGTIVRLVNGRSEGWQTSDIGDSLLRPAPSFRLIASGSPPRQGMLYGWDPVSSRVVAYQKQSGKYVEQYVLAPGPGDWSDIRGMYVQPAGDTTPAVLYWIEKGRLLSAALEAASAIPSEPPSSSPSASASASPTPSASPSKKP